MVYSTKKSPYRKPKLLPANYDQINKWEMPKITPEDIKGPFTEESSFATLFPKYREKYIKEVWPAIQKGLADIGIKGELDLIEGSMTVKTTKKTFDPYSIIKARDIIKLVARSVPYQEALRLLEDCTYCDIIKIKNLVNSREKFVKRRQRLMGPNGETLKALEILTECYISIQGSTVSAIGNYKKLKMVRRVIEDVMSNIHPLYIIKELMIKKELEKDEKLKNENWDRFLPKFKKINEARKKIKKQKKEKIRSAFPNVPTPRKEDLAMESGEYFMSEQNKKDKKLNDKISNQKNTSEIKRQKKVEMYQDPGVISEIQKSVQSPGVENSKIISNSEVDVEGLVKKFKVSAKLNL